MVRSLIAFGIVAALLSVGCVPVTEPVGDITKAEADKELVGKWSVTKFRGYAGFFKIKSLAFDVPDVKGNPKGLMHAVMKGDPDDELWFSITTVGKHTYANVILVTKDATDSQNFNKEGEFAKWKKAADKQYFIFRYTRDGDKLTLDFGNDETFGKLMRDAKIKGNGGTTIEFYSTPAGWLAEYLGKTGPDKVFDGTNMLELKREKK